MAPVKIKPILHTPRLTFTHFSWANPKDINIAIGVFNDPVSLLTQGDFNVHTEAALRHWVAHSQLSRATYEKAYKASGKPIPLDDISPPTSPPWFVVHLGANDPNGERIGMVTLMEAKPAIPHIGWIFLQAYTGKGYATEAARKVMRYWRDEFGIKVLICLTDEHNRGSWNIAQKLGLVRSKQDLTVRGINLPRTLNGKVAHDTVIRCYSTPGAPEFADGQEFVLLRESGEFV